VRAKKTNLAFAHLGLLLCCLGFGLPFFWMVSTSLKTLDAISPTSVEQEQSIQFIPDPVVWENYPAVVMNEKLDFPLYTRNTLIIALLAVVGNTLSSAIVAYGFARIKFKGRGALFAVMLATMMIPFPVVMISTFTLFKLIGDYTPIQMLGTFRPLWVPAWFGSAFSIFLLRQFFLTLPEELSEAARIDGCSEAGIFLRVMLPLARPALAVVALFTFMGVWNDYLGPLVYLQRPEQYTLALGLQVFQSAHGGSQWNLLMAASVLVILPVMLLFFLTQRTFIQGIATTGMKG
jgi:multiple sugar transport system permease protein